MKRKILFFAAVVTAVFFIYPSCKKEAAAPQDNNPAVNAVPLAFSELKAQSTGLHVGETTVITAVVSGNNLAFSWSCTAGTLVGEGAEVTYGSTCNSCVGLNTITCTVSDGNTSQTKSIEVSIK